MRSPVPPWRYRFVARPEHLGLLRLILLTALFYGLFVCLIVFFAMPRGTAIEIEGRITGMGFHETDTGSRPMASIDVGKSDIRIDLPAHLDCRVGDTIRLKRQSLRFGYAYGVGANPHPCSGAGEAA